MDFEFDLDGVDEYSGDGCDADGGSVLGMDDFDGGFEYLESGVFGK